MVVVKVEDPKRKEYHVMPMDDCIEHEDKHDCVCEPDLDAENEWLVLEGLSDSIIWIHRHIGSEKQ